MLLVLIEQDPQISAKILGLANSAQIGVSRHVRTVKDAVMLLGLKRVQSVATGIAIMSMMSKPPSAAFDMQSLWLHSFGVAFAMLGLVRFMPIRTHVYCGQFLLIVCNFAQRGGSLRSCACRPLCRPPERQAWPRLCDFSGNGLVQSACRLVSWRK